MKSSHSNNPYVGPFSFSSSDEDRFFGRKKETSELVTLVRKSRLTILFGSSGTGKTSLIHAKLLPQLQREYFHPVYIRINFESADPLAFTRQRIVEELRKWEPGMPAFAEGQTLLEYAANTYIFKGLVKPVLFFDQFEELFTLGPQNDPVKIRDFILELSDLIELRLSDNLKEDEFIYNLKNFKVVFSLRQDWIAHLEDYSHVIPSVLENRYRLKKFSSQQAEDAIYFPAKSIITRQTAKAIIRTIGEKALIEELGDDFDSQNDLKGLVTDPFVLSLYCYELYEKFVVSSDAYIYESLVNDNSPKKLIRDYYNMRTDGKEFIRNLVEDKLVNESGKRLILTLDAFTSANASLTRDVRDFALKTGIIRITGEDSKCEVEIVHDKLAIEIFESRNERIAKTLTEEAYKKESEAEKLRLSAQKAEAEAEDLRLSAQSADAEAEKLRLSAKKAKRTTILVITIASIIIAFGVTYAIIYTNKIIKEGKANYTVIGLQEQLDSAKSVNQTAQAEIQRLNEEIKGVNLGSPDLLVNRLNDSIKIYKTILTNERAALTKTNRSNDSLEKKNTDDSTYYMGRVAILEGANKILKEKVEKQDAVTYQKPLEDSISPKLPTPELINFKILNTQSDGSSLKMRDLTATSNSILFSFDDIKNYRAKGEIFIRVNYTVKGMDKSQIPKYEQRTNLIPMSSLKNQIKSYYRVLLPSPSDFDLVFGEHTYDVVYVDENKHQSYIIHGKKFNINK